MPSKSLKQARMMARASTDEEYAASRNVPVEVAREFHEEDKKEGKFVNAEGQIIEEPMNPWA